MNKFMRSVRSAVEPLPWRPLMVATGAATAAAVIYYYVNQDDEEKTSADTEDANNPEDSNNPQQRMGPEPTLTQLSIQVKEVVLPSAGLRNSNVSADHQNTLQSPSGLATHQSGASSSHESLESTCATCETEETDMDRGETEEEVLGLFIPDPMLCCEAEEGKIPHSLETLYQTAQCNSASDCLLLAAHVLLLETGFLPQGCDIRAREMPSSWRATGGLYRLQYSHPFCENSQVQMVAVLMGQALVINAALKTNGAEVFSWKLALNLDDYVTKEWAGGEAGVAYRDLQKLSRVFKDQLVYPLIATAREALGLPAQFGLAVLPPELLLRIMRLLDVPSVLKLSEVCRCLHSATQDASLWKHFVYRDFGAGTEHRDTDWKKLYKKKFQQKKAWCRVRCFVSDIPRIHPHPLVPIPPLPLRLPGIIGGEYDRRPAILQAILPRPRYSPIGLFLGYEPPMRLPFGHHLLRPWRSQAPDTRRGFL